LFENGALGKARLGRGITKIVNGALVPFTGTGSFSNATHVFHRVQQTIKKGQIFLNSCVGIDEFFLMTLIARRHLQLNSSHGGVAAGREDTCFVNRKTFPSQ
jgi:hypothetical protein